ncbi:2-methylcitrate dehydratase PrpD, partial [Lindgomyces ingoldianus]
PEHYDVGRHITSTVGSVRAAVAVGKLLGLDTTCMQHAIGLAVTQVVGMQEFFGSDTKSFHVGRVAQGGMVALLAKDGYISSLQGLEAKHGWLHVVSARETATAYFDQLGKIWEIEKNTFKPFSCGIFMHPTIDGAIQLSNETHGKGLSIDNIKSVELRVDPEVMVLTGKTNPQTGMEEKFSIFHAAAVGLLYGDATPSRFTDEVVRNKGVVDMRKKINVTEDNSVPTDAACVTVQFNNRTEVEKHIEHAKGSIENPLTDTELKKFMEQVALAIGEPKAEDAYQAFTSIENMDDVRKVRMMY